MKTTDYLELSFKNYLNFYLDYVVMGVNVHRKRVGSSAHSAYSNGQQI